MKRILLLLLFLALSFPAANATVTLQFNNNSNNVVGGLPQTVVATPGSTLMLSLQIVATTETVRAFDIWLSQFSGPAGSVFSLVGRDTSGPFLPITLNSLVLSPGDLFSNSQFAPAGTSDGVPDNVLGPRNGPSLGGRDGGTIAPPGTHQIATFSIAIAPGAALGLYEIRTFSYPGAGWADENFVDHNFDGQAAISILVVPEPGTGLLLLGGLGVLSMRVLRRRVVSWMGRKSPVLSRRSLGGGGCSMKITEDVRRYAAEQGIAEEEALELGMQEKRKESADRGAELYAKA